MLLTSNVLLILNPLVFRQAVLVLTPTYDHEENLAKMFGWIFGSYLRSTWPWALLLSFIAVTSALFKYWMRLGFISISRDVERDVRSLLFQKIQQQ